jgi:hypothetical protein
VVVCTQRNSSSGTMKKGYLEERHIKKQCREGNAGEEVKVSEAAHAVTKQAAKQANTAALPSPPCFSLTYRSPYPTILLTDGRMKTLDITLPMMEYPNLGSQHPSLSASPIPASPTFSTRHHAIPGRGGLRTRHDALHTSHPNLPNAVSSLRPCTHAKPQAMRRRGNLQSSAIPGVYPCWPTSLLGSTPALL